MCIRHNKTDGRNYDKRDNVRAVLPGGFRSAQTRSAGKAHWNNYIYNFTFSVQRGGSVFACAAVSGGDDFGVPCTVQIYGARTESGSYSAFDYGGV